MTTTQTAATAHHCPDCQHQLMDPEPAGQPGDDSYYCEGCGLAWSLDLRHVVL